MLPPRTSREVPVRLRLFPREEAYFDLFQRAGANAAEAARVLVEMMDNFGEAKARAERLTELEHDADALRASWEKVQELEDEGDRLYRRTRAELYEFSDDQPHPARYLLLWKDIVEQLEEAIDGVEDVADTIESIVLKYA